MALPASIWKQTEQNPQRKQENFTDLVKAYLEEKGMTWAELARRSNLSKSTTTRIRKDTDYRGHIFQPSYHDVLKVSIGLGIGAEGYQRLLEAAFPQTRELERLLKYDNVTDAEIYLAEKGLPPLSKTE